MVLVGLVLSAVLFQQSPVAAQAAPQGAAELRGRLVDLLTGQPVPGATVRLAITKTPPVPPRSVTSDDAGAFVFSGLASGQYNLSVNRSGVVTTMFGAPEGRRVTPVIADGATVNLGDVKVPTGAPISGQILDDAGNPLKGADVSAWRMRYLNPGERRLDFMGRATSAENGDYRINALPPGTYFVSAKSTETNAPTFFPATATATEAAPIRVTATAGANASIRLLSVPLARVSGQIVDARGEPSVEFYVMLAPLRDDGAQVSSASLTSEVDAAGKFTVTKVPPGKYNVEVIAKARLEAIATTGGAGVGVRGTDESGSARVTVDGADVGDVFVRTQPATIISGRVIIDGTKVSAEIAARLTLRISENAGPGSVSSVMNASFAVPDAAGMFAMKAIPGGRLIRVTGLPAGTALKRVLVGGADITDAGFDVSSSPVSDVVVELTSKPAVVSGRITDDQGTPIGGAGVIVYSTDQTRWRLVQTRVVVAGRAKSDGTFSFPGLPAGSYYIAGVPELVDGDWAEPDHLGRLRIAAQTFKLVEGETKDLTVVIKK